MVRLSPMGNETFAMLEAFRANETALRRWISPAIAIATATETIAVTGASGLINRSLC